MHEKRGDVHDERYARQRLIGGWNQERLAAASVLVAGVGALGNEVVKNLALAGVGHLLLLDMDRVERSNLSRTLLFDERDIDSPKVVAAARAVARLNPTVQVTPLDGDLRVVLGLGRLHRCTLALGCLDNQGTRSLLSRMCMLAQVPLLDSGMWAWGGEVRAFLTHDDPCFDCTLAEAERTDLWVRFSCSGFRAAEDAPPEPTTISTTAIVAGLLAQEAVRVLSGPPPDNGRVLVYNGLSNKLHQTTLLHDPACPNHTPLEWTRVQHIATPAARLTAREVLNLAVAQTDAPPILHLGRDLVIAFDCPVCGAHEEVGHLQRLLDEATRRCPRCGTPRTPQITSSVAQTDAWADWTLARLGVPDGEVISVSVGETLYLYEVE